MANTITKIPFKGTKEQQEELFKAIDRYSGQSGALIPVLQEAQKIYGYLPYEVQKYVADSMGFSVSYVSSVSSIYSFFSTTPRTKHEIKVCLGTACYVRGSKKLLEKLQELLGIGIGEATPDNLFSIHVTRCVGACGLAPVVVVDDDVHKTVQIDDLPGILDQYRGE